MTKGHQWTFSAISEHLTLTASSDTVLLRSFQSRFGLSEEVFFLIINCNDKCGQKI